MKINAWIIPGLQLTNQRKHDLLIKAVCDYYLVSEEELRSGSRQGHIVKAKKAICYYLNENFKLTQTVIASKYNLKLARLSVRHHIVTYKGALEVKDRDTLKLHDSLKMYL